MKSRATTKEKAEKLGFTILMSLLQKKNPDHMAIMEKELKSLADRGIPHGVSEDAARYTIWSKPATKQPVSQKQHAMNLPGVTLKNWRVAV